MHYAAHKGDTKLIKILKRLGADLNVTNKAGYTPMDVASYNFDTKVVEYFKRNGCLGTTFFNSSYTG